MKKRKIATSSASSTASSMNNEVIAPPKTNKKQKKMSMEDINIILPPRIPTAATITPNSSYGVAPTAAVSCSVSVITTNTSKTSSTSFPTHDQRPIIDSKIIMDDDEDSDEDHDVIEIQQKSIRERKVRLEQLQSQIKQQELNIVEQKQRIDLLK